MLWSHKGPSPPMLNYICVKKIIKYLEKGNTMQLAVIAKVNGFSKIIFRVSSVFILFQNTSFKVNEITK